MVSIVLTVLAASKVEVKVKKIEIKTSKVLKDVLKLIVLMILPGLIWFAIWAVLPDSVKGNFPLWDVYSPFTYLRFLHSPPTG
ncbi:hypothetical protein [Thermococcus stetteri]|uniref:hypothetical protein n=1 Tax=Thermococcus stetteri TaxID=49900 RepID=UPI001AE42AA4|nr:hypothetical protein [Thermococcus stetteri]MBP1911521.1 ABC-type polysaccharide transport system permease subunit [Thermococcus stetteri]